MSENPSIEFLKEVIGITRELKYHRHFTVSIDFDDTIADEAFPKVGDLKKDADKYINMMYDLGFNIIINTCRADHFQQHAEDFLKEKGIKYHQINCNLPQSVDYYKQDCRKISADVYIDDKCLMGLPDTWEEIFYLTIEKANKYYEKATLG